MKDTSDTIKQLVEPGAVNLTGFSVIGFSLSDALVIVQILVGVTLVVYNLFKIYEFTKKLGKKPNDKEN